MTRVRYPDRYHDRREILFILEVLWPIGLFRVVRSPKNIISETKGERRVPTSSRGKIAQATPVKASLLNTTFWCRIVYDVPSLLASVIPPAGPALTSNKSVSCSGVWVIHMSCLDTRFIFCALVGVLDFTCSCAFIVTTSGIGIQFYRNRKHGGPVGCNVR